MPDVAWQATESMPVVNWFPLPVLVDFKPADNEFTFLNLTHSFGNNVDWDYGGHGRLWTFYLNYFDWLQDEGLTVAERLQTIKDYARQLQSLRDGLHSYTISLRAVNWILFFNKYSIMDKELCHLLYKHCYRLAAFPECEIGANHLLENGLSLYIVAHFFNEPVFHQKAVTILLRELPVQILEDGGHYERSAMYHSLLLQRVLRCVEAGNKSGRFSGAAIAELLQQVAGKMLGWLQNSSFQDGSLPHFGDSNNGVAPSVNILLLMGASLGILPVSITLLTSGYRKLVNNRYELVVQAGNPSPVHQPGHAHDDGLSFILHANKQPLVVDVSISTYNNNEIRKTERSVHFHNTVAFPDGENAELWSSFRLGRRGMITALSAGVNHVQAGRISSKKRYTHQRKFLFEKDILYITDDFETDSTGNHHTYLHFHPDVNVVMINEKTCRANNYTIHFDDFLSVALQPYFFAVAFNKRITGQRIVAVPGRKTTITIQPIANAD